MTSNSKSRFAGKEKFSNRRPRRFVGENLPHRVQRRATKWSFAVSVPAYGDRVEAGTRGCIMYEFIPVEWAKIRDKVLRHSTRINTNKDKFLLRRIDRSSSETSERISFQKYRFNWNFSSSAKRWRSCNNQVVVMKTLFKY